MHSRVCSGCIDHWHIAGMVNCRLRGHRRTTLDVKPRFTEAVVEHHRIESDVNITAREGQEHEDMCVLVNRQKRPSNADAEVGHDSDES